MKVGAGTRTAGKQQQQQQVGHSGEEADSRRNFDLCCKPKASRHIIAALFRKITQHQSFLSLHCSLNDMSCQVMYPKASVTEQCGMIIVKNGGARPQMTSA